MTLARDCPSVRILSSRNASAIPPRRHRPPAAKVPPIEEPVQPYSGLLSTSLRSELRRVFNRLQSQMALAQVWRWEFVRLREDNGDPLEVTYLGRRVGRESACSTFGLVAADTLGGARTAMRSPRRILVSEVPVPGALRVPARVHVVVPLGRPLEDIVGDYSKSLRRRLMKELAHVELRRVTDHAEIERIHREMLVPFARARHGDGAHNFPIEFVRKVALARGRLDLVLLHGEEVACKLAYGMVQSGRRYWVALRVGYPEAVFSDPDRLGETNSISSFAGLVQAHRERLRFLRPGAESSPLRRWELAVEAPPRRLSGSVLEQRPSSSSRSPGSLRLPSSGTRRSSRSRRATSLFDWACPRVPSDEDVANRYREIGFGGLTKVYLHCARRASDDLLRQLRSRYERFPHPPEVVVLATS